LQDLQINYVIIIFNVSILLCIIFQLDS
jgi:hypothetical protein